jgi:phospholipid transport system substrate-binding protein
MKLRWRNWILGFVAALLIAAPSVEASRLSGSSNPMVVVQGGVDQILEIIRINEASKGSLRERRAETLRVVESYFDFEEMAKRSLGPAWREQSPQKREEFVRLFRDLIFNTYVDRVEKNAGAGVPVIYAGEEMAGDYAVVKTRVKSKSHGEVEIQYRLKLLKGNWKVYDVVVEGISFISNYRQQFNSMLAGGSFEMLLGQLRAKVDREVRL